MSQSLLLSIELKNKTRKKLNDKIKKLTREWYQKLKESGFKDVENCKEILKDKDRRTIGFMNRDVIEKFFIDLDHFLEENKDYLHPIDFNILRFYSDGLRIDDICKQVKCSKWKIYDVIKRYKRSRLEWINGLKDLEKKKI